MSVYRAVWRLVCGVLGVVGLVVVVFAWPLGTIITLLLMAAIVGGVLTWIMLIPEGDNPRLSPDRRRVVATSTVLSGAGCVALIGLWTLLGTPTALVLIGFAIGGSPHTIRFCLHWLGEHGYLSPPPREASREGHYKTSSSSASEPGPTFESGDALADPTVPAELSDDALCLAWRASFSALKRATSPAQRLRIVEERQSYLDELERRHPRGMAAWLASGARAAGDPSKFVLGDSGAGRSPIDWEGLIHHNGE